MSCYTVIVKSHCHWKKIQRSVDEGWPQPSATSYVRSEARLHQLIFEFFSKWFRTPERWKHLVETLVIQSISD